MSGRSRAIILLSRIYLVDARLAHSQKYTDNLRNIFPTSTIVLVMVTAGFYFSMEKSRVSEALAWL